MNETKIEYLDFTWNPAVGCHGASCEVRARGKCWAMAQAKRQKHRCRLCYKFIPHLHKERLEEPLKRKKPARIGVCFSSDLFGLHEQMTNYILSIIKTAHWHTFVALTKQTSHLTDFRYPRNLWLGVSVNTKNDLVRIHRLRETNAKVKAVSFEPLYEEINCSLKGIDWIIIGAETSGRKVSFAPKREWVENLVAEAQRHKTAIWLKNNLHPNTILRTEPIFRQELPKPTPHEKA